MRPAVRIIFAPLANRRRNEMRVGEADKANRTIRIDPRVANVAKTLYHELTHVRHPDWGEERVEAEEELRWGRLSWKQKARLYQLLGSARIEGEE
jgi:hypothetical protein